MNTTFVRRTAEVIEIHKGHEYAKFIIDDFPGKHTLAVESSYGGFVYTWGAPGSSFTAFLSKIDLGYVSEKMTPLDEEYDCNTTLKNIVEALDADLRNRTIPQEVYDFELGILPESNSGELEFCRWLDATTWTDDPSEWYCVKPGGRSRSFDRMCELFWGDFTQILQSLSGV